MKKTRLVLLPGMLNTSAGWQWVVPRLEEVADIRIADFTSQSSIQDMATDALALIDDGQQAAIAGFSMGGFVAAEMLRQAPERISHVALIDTSVRTESPRQAEARNKLVEAAIADFEGQVVASAGGNLHPDHRGDTRMTDIIRQMSREVGLDAYVRQNRALMERADYREVLAEVGVPAAVICGTSDEMTPPRLSEELAALIPGAVLEWIDPAAHMTLLEQPEQVAQALRRLLAR